MAAAERRREARENCSSPQPHRGKSSLVHSFFPFISLPHLPLYFLPLTPPFPRRKQLWQLLPAPQLHGSCPRKAAGLQLRRGLSCPRLQPLQGRWGAWGAKRHPGKCQGWKGSSALRLLLFCLRQQFPWGSGGGCWREAVDDELFPCSVWQGQEAHADCNGSRERCFYPKMLVLTKPRGSFKGQSVRCVLDPSLACPKLLPARAECSAKAVKISQALASFFLNYFLGNS